MTTIDDNGYVDIKNAVMLAVLGLYETLELFKSSNDKKYWVEDHHLCFSNDLDSPYQEVYKWYIPAILKNEGVLNILGW